MSISNFERWRLYTKSLSSPDSFINFGFYNLIACALQRRVWVGPDHMKLFANQYLIMCGPPGVGKGLVVKTILRFLTYHKAQVNNNAAQKSLESLGSRGSDKEVVEPHQFFSQDTRAVKSSLRKEDPLLIPMASESTTWEALIKAMVDSYSGIRIDGKPYTYCALCFCLEEFSSLLKKKAEDVAKFLIIAYDCGDYTYETMLRGKDRVKNMCLNMCAGTTPSFMQQLFDERFIDDGLSSRAFFVYEYANRFNMMFPPDLDIDQKIAEKELLIHVRELTKLKGRVSYTTDVIKKLDLWWENFPKTPRVNMSHKLNGYYSRKNIHVQKLAMAIHFGESSDPKNMIIGMKEIEQAMYMLDEAERKMHFALQFKAKNPLSVPSDKILDLLKTSNGLTVTQVHEQMWESLRESELQEVLTFLISNRKIVEDGVGLNKKLFLFKEIK